MKEWLINRIVSGMNLDREESERLKNLLYMELHDYSITPITQTDIVGYSPDEDEEIFKMFIVSKNIQGCTRRTLETYNSYLKQFFIFVNKPIREITSNDIKYFMAVRVTNGNILKSL